MSPPPEPSRVEAPAFAGEGRERRRAGAWGRAGARARPQLKSVECKVNGGICGVIVNDQTEKSIEILDR